ncbi:nuclear transport factor 2 family protein [Geomicrobium sp. JSM 1781026]|uniref:nuclear transport factor 2 family protein n=1 Tax=Geomicrobium sp. JSM 1781026 TaxID=3344580 RepID=UPI0035BFE19D
MNEQTMLDRANELFTKYEQAFNGALNGEIDMHHFASFYTDSFIAANPNGVMTGDNDESLQKNMKQGYEYYRSIGTKAMQCLHVKLNIIDAHHGVAHTEWQASYVVNEKTIHVPFRANYLLQFQKGEPKIFGWITGDESELLHKYGVI